MGFGDIHGRAKVDPRRPRAFGVSDFSGFWFNHNDLVKQYEWSGTALVWTGMLVPRCEYDTPQPQLKAIRLPPDPVPIKNPRPEAFSLIDRQLGFTQYVMWAGGQPLEFAVVLDDGNGNPILTNTGQQILLEIGSDGPALLAQLAQMTGIPVPGTIQNYSGTIGAQNVSQVCIPAQASRSYIAIFNPCNVPMGVNIGTATVGVLPSITIGAGNCLFWATAQGFGTPTALEIDICSVYPGVPFYAYAAP